MAVLPRYPIYVPTKGRHESALTIKFLLRDGVPFRAVVEEAELDPYRRVVGDGGEILVLPEAGRGLLYARNWIRDHAEAEGHERHWQLDDNIAQIRRLYRGERIPCASGPAFAALEDLSDRYENVALSGFNYQMFVLPSWPPMRVNVHVYSATLVNHAAPFRWRLLYNDDTDLCLQALVAGWTTILVNAFMIAKMPTMTVRGGNTDSGGPINYQGDGRLRMARVLEEAWPGIVSVDWRYGRPQHVVDWNQFKTPLKLRPGVDLDSLPPVDEYGLELVEKRPVESERLRALLELYPRDVYERRPA
jgi:hypothetical protein